MFLGVITGLRGELQHAAQIALDLLILLIYHLPTPCPSLSIILSRKADCGTVVSVVGCGGNPGIECPFGNLLVVFVNGENISPYYK